MSTLVANTSTSTSTYIELDKHCSCVVRKYYERRFGPIGEDELLSTRRIEQQKPAKPN